MTRADDRREVAVEPVGSPAENPSRSGARPSRVSRIAIAAVGVVAFVLVAWFFVAWLVLDRHIVDSAGESIGSAFAILLVVSFVGAFRRNRG